MALSCCKKWSPLLKGITSNHDGEFFCLNCFHILQEIKLKKHENVYKNHDYCYTEMPKEYQEILKYNHGENLWKFNLLLMLI